MFLSYIETMPIELWRCINDSDGWSFMSTGLNKLFGSKISVTSVLTVIVIILVMIIYPSKQNTKPWVLFKLGFYVFVATFGVILIHDAVINSNIQKTIKARDDDHLLDVLGGQNNAVYENDHVKPIPNAYAGAQVVHAESPYTETAYTEYNSRQSAIGGVQTRAPAQINEPMAFAPPAPAPKPAYVAPEPTYAAPPISDNEMYAMYGV